jgi:hypothetical protein
MFVEKEKEIKSSIRSLLLFYSFFPCLVAGYILHPLKRYETLYINIYFVIHFEELKKKKNNSATLQKAKL